MIYARISMDRTGAGLGVLRQREDCERLIEDRGWALVETLADNDVSAYSGKPRPGYRALLALMQSRAVDVVVAWHTDRLHRNPSELEEYIRVSEASHTATVTVRAGDLDLSTAAGRMVARMLGAAARHESEQKSERVRRRRRQDAEAGRAHGPLGYGYDEHQHVVPAEASVIREVTTRLLGGHSLYSIASDLNVRNIPTPGAGHWSHNQITRMLNPKVVADQTGSLAVLRSIPISVQALVRAASTAHGHDDDRIASLLNGASVATALGNRWTAEDISDSPIQKGVLELVHLLRSQEPSAPGRVARALNSAGVPAPKTTWRAANLRSMIRRGTLCGWRDFGPGGRGGGDMIAKGDWEPILTRDESMRIRRVLDAPERKRTGRERRLLLSSILVCGRCGAPLGGYDSPRDGRRYACSSQPGLDRCGRLTIIAEPVERAVVAAVLEALTDSRFRRRQESAGDDEKHTQAELEFENVRRQRQDYARDAAEGRITREEWMIVRDGLAERLARVERTLVAARRPNVSVLGSIPTTRSSLEAWWDAASLTKQREVLKLLLQRVIVQPATRRGNQFDLSRLGAPEWRY